MLVCIDPSKSAGWVSPAGLVFLVNFIYLLLLFFTVDDTSKSWSYTLLINHCYHVLRYNWRAECTEVLRCIAKPRDHLFRLKYQTEQVLRIWVLLKNYLISVWNNFILVTWGNYFLRKCLVDIFTVKPKALKWKKILVRSATSVVISAYPVVRSAVTLLHWSVLLTFDQEI